MVENQQHLATVERAPGLLRPTVPVREIVEVQTQVSGVIKAALRPGQDFGRIPGTERDVLLKSGAEKIASAFGCGAAYEIIDRDVDHFVPVTWAKRRREWSGQGRSRTWHWVDDEGVSYGLYRFVVRCRLVHRQSGEVVGEGVGSCSTMESRYVQNPRDYENTVLKMAQKRALVSAVLGTFGLSGQFGQDEEDRTEPEVVAPQQVPVVDQNRRPTAAQAAAAKRLWAGDMDQFRNFRDLCSTRGVFWGEAILEAVEAGVTTHDALLQYMEGDFTREVAAETISETSETVTDVDPFEEGL